MWAHPWRELMSEITQCELIEVMCACGYRSGDFFQKCPRCGKESLLREIEQGSNLARLQRIEKAAREVVASHNGERSAIDFAAVSLKRLEALRQALGDGRE
jgi:predicted ATP-dependent serine protease